MVGASITLSVIAVVITFILGVLGSFPLGNGDEYDSSGGYDPAHIEEAGKRLELSYTGIIEDIASFQKDPDLERAEARKEAFTEFAESLVGEYKEFSEDMQLQMDDLISQSNEEAEAL